MPSSTSCETLSISIGARSSLLSVAQVKEVLKDIRRFFPNITFDCHYLETIGDKDLKTSLRDLDKTNFFTKEVDELQLNQGCRISIHSAKDLPEPLAEGLEVIAITSCIDPSDSLVMRQGDTIESLPPGSWIATSSERREDMVKLLRPDFRFKDLRGTIGQRLAKLQTGEADGVVIAEAALIRLKLTHHNRVKLPGETTPRQGQLAIVARTGDEEMKGIFSKLDTR